MIQFAVIGVGRMGKIHVKNLAKGLVPHTQLAAVVDILKEERDWMKKNYPSIPCFSSVSEMIASKKIDAAIIVTPHYSHKDIAIELIKNSIHTLIEKPIVPSVDLAQEIIDFAKENKQVKVGVSYNQRSNPLYIQAKALLTNKTLGDIQRVNFIITDWYRSQAYYNQGGWRATYQGEGGGCLMNQCIHQIDILQWLVGMPNAITSIMHTINRDISVENDVSAILHYENFDCVFQASTHELSGVNRLEIACDKGRIVIGPRKMDIYIHESEKQVNKSTKDGYGASSEKVEHFYYNGAYYRQDKRYGQQLRSLTAFIEEIEGKGCMLAKVEEGINALQIINGIYLANEKQEKVNLPIQQEEYKTYLQKMIDKENK